MGMLTRSEVDTIAGSIAAHLTTSWNNGNGELFASVFTEDAVFVNVYGEILYRRETIAAGHQFIFDRAFKGVSINYRLIDAVQIGDEVILAHNRGAMLQSEDGLTMTLVIVNEAGRWFIRALHNTTVSVNRFTKPQ
jgi:uncharacterized protein (TIGR02246 family)